MKNPVPLGNNMYVLRGFPANIKVAKHNPNIVNMTFHSDTTLKWEPIENMITVSCFLNDNPNKVSMGEIALQCKNRFVVVECEKEVKNKNGRIFEDYIIKNITIIPLNVYGSEYTKEKIEENQEDIYLSDEDINDMPF